MKTQLTVLSLLAFLAVPAFGASSIHSTNKYAYGANIGWVNWQGDTNNGAVIGEYVCSGYLYGANVGWIHLGDGTPANGIAYANNSASDYGVNHDTFGNLRGLAYGANIGWINFTNATATGPLAAADLPRVDLKTGRLAGYAYSANCGWISLSNAFAFVQTVVIPQGLDADADGMTDAWELQNFGGLGNNGSDDFDGDGFANLSEYLAGTNPNNPSDFLRITSITAASLGANVTLTWTSVSNRCYNVVQASNLLATVWGPSGLGDIPPDAGTTTSRSIVGPANTNRFYRVSAFRALGP